MFDSSASSAKLRGMENRDIEHTLGRIEDRLNNLIAAVADLNSKIGEIDSRRNSVSFDSLTPSQRRMYEHLREWRSAKAEESGVRLWHVMTNAQLAAIAAHAPLDMQALREVPGLGDERASKHGAEVLPIVAFHVDQGGEW